MTNNLDRTNIQLKQIEVIQEKPSGTCHASKNHQANSMTFHGSQMKQIEVMGSYHHLRFHHIIAKLLPTRAYA
jgi:hypothetical protein